MYFAGMLVLIQGNIGLKTRIQKAQGVTPWRVKVLKSHPIFKNLPIYKSDRRPHVLDA